MDEIPLPPWRWLKRATATAPLITIAGGIIGALLTPGAFDESTNDGSPITLAFALAFFSVFVSVPFGLACRVLIGDRPAGRGVVLAAAATSLMASGAVNSDARTTPDGSGGLSAGFTLMTVAFTVAVAVWFVRADRTAATAPTSR